MKLPRFGLIKQLYHRDPEPDVGALLSGELSRTRLLEAIRPGERVLLTAGSRGINSMPEVLSGLVKAVKAAGAKPFIYPAMGSHGGGTTPGQVEFVSHRGYVMETGRIALQGDAKDLLQNPQVQNAYQGGCKLE